MNTLSGTLSAGGSQVVVPGGVVPLPDALARVIRDRTTDAITVGVRPEHLTFAPDGLVTAKVTLVESLGHERLVVCSVADGTLIIVRLDSDEVVPPTGADVKLTTSVDHVHLFDTESSARIDPLEVRPS